MKKYISNYIDNGKTDGSKSIRFFMVFLSSIFLSAISLSFLYVVYNKTKGFVSANINVSFSFLSDAFLYLAGNYLFGAFILLSMIFALFSLNHVNHDKKSVGNHKYKLGILIPALFIYSFFNHMSSLEFVQDDLYYFLTYSLSLLIMSFTVIVFYIPFSTNLKEILNIFKHDQAMFFIFKALILFCFFFALIFLYTDSSDFSFAIMPLGVAFLLFVLRFTSGREYGNELMKLKFELSGFDISGIETKYQSRLNQSLYFSDVEGIHSQLSAYKVNDKLREIKEAFRKHLEENQAYQHMFIFIKEEEKKLYIIDLDGNTVTSS